MANPRPRLQLRLAHLSFVALFLGAIFILMWISARYRVEFDWTATGRNSLSAQSVAVLNKLQKPVEIRAFVSDSQSARAPIRRLVARYQRIKPDLRLRFIDPNKHPELVRRAGVQFDGELQVAYGHRKLMVTQVSEQALTNALASLGRSGLREAVFLSGDGERDPAGTASYDVSAWAKQLTDRGLQVRTDSLMSPGSVTPDGTLLIIAGPKVNLLPGQVQAVERFVSQGGNVLWLQDQGPLRGLRPLAERLGIQFLPGVAVDPTSQVLTGRADFIAITQYGPHPIVRNLNLISVLPVARGVEVKAINSWQAHTLLDTRPDAWEATHPKPGVARFHKGVDIPGPITLGVTLERDKGGHDQRVVVIGDGNFVANGFLGDAGNLELAMNLVNWAAHNDAYINIPARPAPDLHLVLSRTAQLLIALGFLILLPLLLIANGAAVWWRRRRS